MLYLQPNSPGESLKVFNEVVEREQNHIVKSCLRPNRKLWSRWMMVEIWTRVVAVEKETVVNKSGIYLQRETDRTSKRLYMWDDMKKVPPLNPDFTWSLKKGATLARTGRKEKQVRRYTLEPNGGSVFLKSIVWVDLWQETTGEETSPIPSPPIL